MYSSVRTLPPPPPVLPSSRSLHALVIEEILVRHVQTIPLTQRQALQITHTLEEGFNFVPYGPRACETMIDALIVLLRGYTSTYTKEPRLLTKCGFS